MTETDETESNEELLPEEDAASGAAVEEVVEPEDNTEAILRSWGLSGEPIHWAPVNYQPTIAAIRACNTGFGNFDAVQGMLDAGFPDMGYEATAVALAHPPSADFVIASGDIDPDVDPNVERYLEIIRVDLADDEDLDLPNELVSWDFGDGTAPERDAYGYEHGYLAPGNYTVRCTMPVAGVIYTTAQTHTVGKPEEPVDLAALNPGVLGRDATVFESETDDLPNDNAPPTDDAPTDPEVPDTYDVDTAPLDARVTDFDPGDHTVAEVKEYLAQNPEQMDRVLSEEQTGKQRAGILDL
jgi:hypothetical protein